LVALSAITARQAYTTIATEQAVQLLLDYVATYLADGIVYRSSDMILMCPHRCRLSQLDQLPQPIRSSYLPFGK
jgi:hypothetical protein